MLRLTLCRSRTAGAAAKVRRRSADGRETESGYQNETWWRFRSAEMATLQEMADLLRRLARRPDLAIIRGDPAPNVAVPLLDAPHQEGGWHVRRSNAPPVTIVPAPRRWMALDVDSPPDVYTVRDVMAALPDGLADVDHVVTPSAGTAIKPGLRCRIWVALHAPLPDYALVRWAMAANASAGSKLIDTALFQAIQLHYTARPIFEGMYDPVPAEQHAVFIERRHRAAILYVPPPPAQPFFRQRGRAPRSLCRDYIEAIRLNGAASHGLEVKAIGAMVAARADAADVDAVMRLFASEIEELIEVTNSLGGRLDLREVRRRVSSFLRSEAARDRRT